MKNRIHDRTTNGTPAPSTLTLAAPTEAPPQAMATGEERATAPVRPSPVIDVLLWLVFDTMNRHLLSL